MKKHALAAFVVVVAPSACAQIIGIENLEPAGDAATDGARDGFVEGAADAPPEVSTDGGCSPTAPFTRTDGSVFATIANSLSGTNGERAARLTADELTMYFARVLASGTNVLGEQLYVAVRGSPTAPFSTPFALDIDDPDGGGADPSISPDGKTLLYMGDGFQTNGQPGLLGASHNGTDAGDFIAVTYRGLSLNREGRPFLGADGTLYFVENNGAEGTNQIAHSSPTDAGSYASIDPSGFGALGGKGYDTAPVVSSDGLVLYFARPGASGGLDVFVATRATTTSNFANAQAVAGDVNGSDDDRPSWISPDQCRLYFDTTTSAGTSTLQLAVRSPP